MTLCDIVRRNLMFRLDIDALLEMEVTDQGKKYDNALLVKYA